VDTPDTTTPADAVVMATPATVTARLLGHQDAALGQLGNVRSAGAAMTTFRVDKGALNLPSHGTGILVPLGTPWTGGDSLMTTAVTFLDRKWPHLRSDDDVLLRAHVGRIDDARWVEMSDERLIERLCAELGLLLGSFGSPDDAIVQRWPDALPQYYLGHESMVTRARTAASSLGVALCGNAYDGVGIPACIGSGRRAGRDALEMLHFSVR
jgi:oxygen-dependent protoporphyrinogen oxidase